MLVIPDGEADPGPMPECRRLGKGYEITLFAGMGPGYRCAIPG